LALTLSLSKGEGCDRIRLKRMKYSSRFFLYAPLLLFLALAAAAGVNWWSMADALSHKLDALNGRKAMPGVTLSFASKTIGGFPFNLDVEFRNFRIEVATDHGPAQWRSEKFALHALAYGREQMIFEAAGKQLLSWTDSKRQHHALPFEVGEWHASSIVDDHGLARFDMDLIGLGSPALIAARIQLHAREHLGAIDLAAEADSVRLLGGLASPFGDTVVLARANASAVPGKSFDAIRVGDASWEATLERWRVAQGVLHVDDLELNWNRFGAIGKGTLSLDPSHAVAGLLDFKLGGMTTFLETAAHKHLSGAANQGIAAALLDRAARSGNNDAALLGAVIGFHDGVVSVGDESATTEEPLY
jgi:hypothetical protein